MYIYIKDFILIAIKMNMTVEELQAQLNEMTLKYDKFRQRWRKNYKTHSEEIKQKSRETYALNADSIRSRRRELYQEGDRKSKQKAYYQKNKAAILLKARARRALKV